MIPLSVPNLGGREWRLVKECIDSNWVSSAGRFVGDFENKICKYAHVKYASACINGTSGLFIALKLLGVEPGCEVIVPTLTFIAPVNTVKYLGAEPVFMDCDDYMNLDPAKLFEFCKNECKRTRKGIINKRSKRIIKTILPVHVFGNPFDMEGVMKVAQEFGLSVVEDATESIGAYYTKGTYKNRFTGAIGDFGVYSFNGNKIITTGGGGMIVGNNKKLSERARYLVNQAKDDPVRYIHNEIGYNFRLTNIQAALGIAQLEQLNSFIEIKKRNYFLYKEGLEGVPGVTVMGVPQNTRPNYWFYSLVIDKNRYGMDKEQLMRKLSKENIQTRPIWHPNHFQKPYAKNQSYRIEKAVWFWERVLNLPCSTDLREEEINKVVSIIKFSGRR